MSTVTLTADARPPAAPGSAAKMQDGVKGFLAALGGVAVATITLLATFHVVRWSSTQTGLATAEAAAAVGFLSALAAHFWPGTKKEPVAVGATLTALVAATLALLSGFKAWKLSQDEISALVGLLTALLAVCTALFARGKVTATDQKAHIQ
jgi:phosphatidylserine synthase